MATLRAYAVYAPVVSHFYAPLIGLLFPFLFYEETLWGEDKLENVFHVFLFLTQSDVTKKQGKQEFLSRDDTQN